MRLKRSKKISDSQGIEITKSKSKRIGYFAALLIVMGSSIGSGIFFKSGSVMTNVNNSIIMSLISWIVAAFAVIAMAVALVDIAAESKKDDRGMLSWTKRFNGLFLYKASKNVYCFFTLPIKFFGLPVFFFQSLQSGLCFIGAHWVGGLTDGHVELSSFGNSVCNLQWWVVLLVVLALDIYFIVINGISIKVGNVTNKIIMYIKFIPLLFAFIIGFVILGVNRGIPADNHWWVDYTPPVPVTPSPDVQKIVQPKLMGAFSPAIGVFLSLAAIFFAYDGFYVAAGIQGELKQPKKISSILLFGLLIVTAIYLGVALSLTFGADGGKWEDVSVFFCKHHVSWIYCIMAILISIGILGVLNGYSMWATRLYNLLITDNEIPFSKQLKKLKNPWSGIVFILSFALIIVVIFSVIGAYGYDLGVSKQVITGYSLTTSVSNMDNFCNLVTNWQTIFTFSFITIAILGSTDKKVKRKGKTKKEYIEIIAGFISVIIIGAALIFQIAQPFVNLGLTIKANNEPHPGLENASIVNNICLIGVLGFALIVCFVPSIFEWKNKRNRQIFQLENRIQDLCVKLNQLETKRNDLLELQKNPKTHIKHHLV